MLDSEKLYALIGDRIRQIREAQAPRMSQAGLAGVLNLQRTSVTNIEAGAQKPTLDTLYRLCEHFGIEVMDIIPRVAEVTRADARPVFIGGQEQEVGAKTASVLNRLRPHPTKRANKGNS